MTHQEFTWKSHDGLLLFAQEWMPDGPARAIINYVHGFKDHSGRIEKLALKLVEKGYGFMAVDLRGHGRSQGRRGSADSFGSFLRDVGVLCENSRALYPGAMHILYGHSLGGNVVTNFLISEKVLPNAAIVASPWFTLAFKPPLIARIGASLFRYILPGVTLKSSLDAGMLSREEQVAVDYLSDPLVHNLILPRLFYEIEEQGSKASKSIYKINIPLLVMHGSGDRITSCRKTREFVRNAGTHTTFKEWPGYYHELHNDTGAGEVIAFMLSWLDRQVDLFKKSRPEPF